MASPGDAAPPVPTPTTPPEPQHESMMSRAAAEPSERPAPRCGVRCWTIDMGSGSGAASRRKVSKREQEALVGGNRVIAPTDAEAPPPGCAGVVVNVDDFVDPAIAIPRNLTVTQEELSLRTHFDTLRFQCVSRPQYKRTCGVSSLTSVWNFLYSRLGRGSLPPVSQEEVMTILGFAPPFDEIRWGSFTGNTTLMRWFHALNAHFGVTGKAFYAWKCHGLGRTIGLSDDAAEAVVTEGLRNPNLAFIYHCHNHYMVPVGYQFQPRAPIHAYKAPLSPGEYDTVLFIGEVSRGKHPCLHVKRFADVATDLNCASPQWFNIRNVEAGVQTRKVGPVSSRSIGGNLHCFIGFRSDVAETDMTPFAPSVDDEEDDDADGVDDTAVE